MVSPYWEERREREYKEKLEKEKEQASNINKASLQVEDD